MKTTAEPFSIQSSEKQQVLNITDNIADAVRKSGIRNGFLALYCQHTTAALFMGEWQRALVEDALAFFELIVSDKRSYKHNCPEFSDCDRHNATSHMRAMLLNHSVQLPIVSGEIILGQFQKVLFAEFDGPRDRSLYLQVTGD